MTKDLQETKYKLENITAEDNQTNGNATHKEIRALIQEKIDFNDDKEFTLSEIKTAVASMKERRHLGRTESQAKYIKL